MQGLAPSCKATSLMAKPFLLTLPSPRGENQNLGSVLVTTGTDRSPFVTTWGVMAAGVPQGPCTVTRSPEPPAKAALTGPCWFLDAPGPCLQLSALTGGAGSLIWFHLQ